MKKEINLEAALDEFAEYHHRQLQMEAVGDLGMQYQVLKGTVETMGMAIDSYLDLITQADFDTATND